MLVGVLATILSAGCANVGRVLQKAAMSTLPRLVYDWKVVKQYLTHSTWATGLALDVGGGLLTIVALADAPVSVVQPISSGGLAILAVFSHFWLDERLSTQEWYSVALAALGTVGVAAAAEAPPDSAQAPPFSLPGLLLLLVLLALAASALRSYGGSARGLPRVPSAGKLGGGAVVGGSPRVAAGAGRGDELFAGCTAGICFALSACCCRAGLLLAASASSGGASRALSLLPAALGMACSLAFTSGGVLAQTRGLKDGNALVVCTVAAVASMLTGVAAGLLVLGERLPGTRRRLAAAVLSWGCIAAGVQGLAGGRVAEGSGGVDVWGRGGLPMFSRPSKDAEATL